VGLYAHILEVGLYAHIRTSGYESTSGHEVYMLISALLNVPLGALQQQQQQRTSNLVPNWQFWRVVGRTRRQKHAAGHYLRDNLIT